MNIQTKRKLPQRGMTLVGLIFIVALVGMVAVVALQVIPSVTEYFSIKKSIEKAKASGTTAHEIQTSFDRMANTGYIDSITGKDLEITKNGDNIQVSFAYQKKIPLFGPVSLVIDYAGSTGNGKTAKPLE